MKKELPLGWPENPPIYNIERSYLENLEQGPFFKGEIPERELPPENEWIDFLGFKVASPIGVPAGPLLNSNWVTFAAEMGFDIVTYKTIRSKEHPAHPLPNMIYVDTNGELTPERHTETLSRANIPPRSMSELALTNSFGIPSRHPEFLIKDIAKANTALGSHQVMIVSVVGTPRDGEDYFEDFVQAAKIAAQAGAKIIEIDLSCPNVAACEGSLYTNPEAVYAISARVKAAVGSIPLIIKIGVVKGLEEMRNIMLAATKAGVEAICGINTVSMKVVDQSGAAALGPNRSKAGVCGSPIRTVALDFINMCRTVNQQENLELVIMATGGVTEPKHFDLFLDAGADVAMSAIGMMWDPYLAARYHRSKQNG